MENARNIWSWTIHGPFIHCILKQEGWVRKEMQTSWCIPLVKTTYAKPLRLGPCHKKKRMRKTHFSRKGKFELTNWKRFNVATHAGNKQRAFRIWEVESCHWDTVPLSILAIHITFKWLNSKFKISLHLF